MISNLLDRFATAGGFVRQARTLGLSARVARLLEPGARHVCPDDPGQVLGSRELLERAALYAAVGDGGNLELSFRKVNLLAGCLETLELTRTGDVPDPFRRVWVSNELGDRARAVALTRENDEIAIFCPPDSKRISEEGTILTLSYRGFSSSVEYKLRLGDSCLFPGGLMLHLTRLEGEGTIGREQERFDVECPGSVRWVDETGEPRETPCEVLDISQGGVRMECAERIAPGHSVSVTLDLPDGQREPFSFDAAVCWARPGGQGRQGHGLLFCALSTDRHARLQQCLGQLRDLATATEA